MSARESAPLWIGVDLGATRVRAARVRCAAGGLGAGDPGPVELVSELHQARFAPFTPVSLAEQREAHKRSGAAPGDSELGIQPEEARAASERIECAADLLSRALQGAPSQRAPSQRAPTGVAVCAPGLRTPDQRGLAVCANAPRAPRWSEQLQAALARRGFDVRIAALVGDGFAAALGESCARAGGLRGIEDGYVLLPGTGLGEGWKRAGTTVPDDERAQLFEPAWSALCEDGGTWEQRLSLRGLNARYERRAVPGAPPRIEHAARAGDASAREELSAWSRALARWIAARAARAAQLGQPWSRVVLGGAACAWLRDTQLGQVTLEPLTETLRELAPNVARPRLGIRAAGLLGAVALAASGRAGTGVRGSQV